MGLQTLLYMYSSTRARVWPLSCRSRALTDHECSVSQVKSAVRGMMSLWPQPLRQMLEGSKDSEAGDDMGQGSKELSEQAGLRKDALLGHLLMMAVKREGWEPPLAAHALPALVSQLEAAGLVPRYERRDIASGLTSKFSVQEICQLPVSIHHSTHMNQHLHCGEPARKTCLPAPPSSSCSLHPRFSSMQVGPGWSGAPASPFRAGFQTLVCQGAVRRC